MTKCLTHSPQDAAAYQSAELIVACYAGLHNLGSLREEGKAAQHQLWDLHTLLMEMCRQIRDHSVLEDKLSAEDWGECTKPLFS